MLHIPALLLRCGRAARAMRRAAWAALCSAAAAAAGPTAQTPAPTRQPPGPPAAGEHAWRGECLTCARFPEMAGFRGRDLDWVARGAVTPPKDRRGCKACGLFAAVSGVESAAFLAGRPLAPLSEQELLDCVPPGEAHPDPCQGGERWRYFTWMERNRTARGGLASAASYPLFGTYSPVAPGECRADLAADVAANVTGWFRLAAQNDTHKEDRLLEALRKVGPMTVCMSYKHLPNYRGGVDNPGQPGSSTGTAPCPRYCDHSMLLVGYGRDPASGLDYWRLQTNDGTHWGEGGYYRLARGHNHCGVADWVYQAFVTDPTRYECRQGRCVRSWAGNHTARPDCERAC